MTKQWRELKETITEMRDNGGTGTQQEVCKFLVNYMETLEKQMREPCEDCISRKAVDKIINKWLSHPDYELKDNIYDMTKKIHKLPSVTPI